MNIAPSDQVRILKSLLAKSLSTNLGFIEFLDYFDIQSIILTYFHSVKKLNSLPIDKNLEPLYNSSQEPSPVIFFVDFWDSFNGLILGDFL